MKLFLLFLVFGIATAIKLNQYIDSSCSNLFQTYYFNLNDCFMAGNGANAMNYTFCNGTYFSAAIYSGTTCTGNPTLTMSGDPRTCALERRLVYCNENAPSNPVIKSSAFGVLVNYIVIIAGIFLNIM